MTNDIPKDIVKKTQLVLMDLKKAGYHIITIGKPDKKNPACRSWMDGPTSFWGWHPDFKGMYNKSNSNACRDPHWPYVWRIRDKYCIDSGSGNGHQAQYSEYKNKFITGTYNLKASDKSIKDRVRRKHTKYIREEAEKALFNL